ncbi:hypothetical protein [Pseudomonas putida]|uniref:Uncharacterized protein n=1 Tax=Pseudomonas putida TaxID=303 RepID=A0A1B2FE58_PSEPU|nr:hypothetical protein [Pseudomonas putida]ANY90462.1 hypothetical protein IEC33019_4980 [Pseudomonas putida]
MDVQVINGPRPGSAADRRLPIVQADAYAVEGLLDILEVRAGRGEREILVLACSPAQAQAVLEWSCLHDDGELQGLEIYLVRRGSADR